MSQTGMKEAYAMSITWTVSSIYTCFKYLVVLWNVVACFCIYITFLNLVVVCLLHVFSNRLNIFLISSSSLDLRNVNHFSGFVVGKWNTHSKLSILNCCFTWGNLLSIWTTSELSKLLNKLKTLALIKSEKFF